MTSPVDLTLVAEHRRGHGAIYEALNRGKVDVPRLRQVLAGLPMPQAADGRLVLAVDFSNWLRPDAPTSAERLFCRVYGRSGRSRDQMISGWPYSFVAALETRRSSWCRLLDAIRLGPEDDVAEVTAAQLRRADAHAQGVRPGLSPGRATAEARQGVPLRRAGHLGRAGRGHDAGRRPVRHRPRDGMGPPPPDKT